MMLPETWSPNQLSFPGKLLPHSTLPLVVVWNVITSFAEHLISRVLDPEVLKVYPQTEPWAESTERSHVLSINLQMNEGWYSHKIGSQIFNCQTHSRYQDDMGATFEQQDHVPQIKSSNASSRQIQRTLSIVKWYPLSVVVVSTFHWHRDFPNLIMQCYAPKSMIHSFTLCLYADQLFSDTARCCVDHHLWRQRTHVSTIKLT